MKAQCLVHTTCMYTGSPYFILSVLAAYDFSTHFSMRSFLHVMPKINACLLALFLFFSRPCYLPPHFSHQHLRIPLCLMLHTSLKTSLCPMKYCIHHTCSPSSPSQFSPSPHLHLQLYTAPPWLHQHYSHFLPHHPHTPCLKSPSH